MFLCGILGFLQTLMTRATVEDLAKCNSLLQYAKGTPGKGLFFAHDAFDFDQAEILSITDASHANDYDVSGSGQLLATGPSQGGWFFSAARSS